MPFTIATWNINSIRLRMNLVKNFLEKIQPDILCLQETKCPDEFFPFNAFQSNGYPYIEIHGQKSYNGVAILSRRPLKLVEKKFFTGTQEARHLCVHANLGKKRLFIHNFYVPAGGYEPDLEKNPKFKQKIDFIFEMQKVSASYNGELGSILLGDLNVAPLEHDVWSHKELLNVVSHTPIETNGLENMRKKGNWIDLMRCNTAYEKKLYTWWSYRAKNWEVSDRGRRLDHIWSSPNLETKLIEIEILKEARRWIRPSDHVPVIARLQD